jgi:alpha,alpha-trehalase
MTKAETPEELLGELFYDVHRSGIFPDGKLFADARMRMSASIIVNTYHKEKKLSGFDLKSFVHQYFEICANDQEINLVDRKPIENHLNDLWKTLERKPHITKEKSSRLALPFPYIVPGGRFNEIYYWDSYFTMLGLKVSGKMDMIESMVNNFTYLINTYGHIPNGNRTYFLSRSQPPFYSLMVKMLIDIKGKKIIKDYLPSLLGEYNFWMKGINQLNDQVPVINRVSKVEKSYLLNRYYDEKDTPREEMYRDDWQLIDYSDEKNRPLFRELRSACESGWDFSSRWLNNSAELSSIQTTDILPIDLNCLLWHLEKLISECYKDMGKEELSINYGILSVNRKKAIGDIFWDDEKNFFFDFNIKTKTLSPVYSLAGLFPLFFGLANQEQADQVAQKVEEIFLKQGGVVTTPIQTGQQWDAPNGWAPLQWITIKGLLKYGHKSLAQEIAYRWINLNKNVYQRTGKMLEKYNVENTSLEGGGGEYPVQDGFGWTNGVYLALTHL